MRHKQDSLVNRMLLPTTCTSVRNLCRISSECVSLYTPPTHSNSHSFALLSSAVHLVLCMHGKRSRKAGRGTTDKTIARICLPVPFDSQHGTWIQKAMQVC